MQHNLKRGERNAFFSTPFSPEHRVSQNSKIHLNSVVKNHLIWIQNQSLKSVLFQIQKSEFFLLAKVGISIDET